MVETKKAAAANPVPGGGPHDKVAMLSLNKDGTPDQNDPEIIGDKEFATEATKRQFREQAVSAVDDAERSGTSGTDDPDQETQDPFIADLKAKHDKAAATSEKAAEKVVAELHEG